MTGNTLAEEAAGEEVEEWVELVDDKPSDRRGFAGRE